MRFFDSPHDQPEDGWLEFVKSVDEPIGLMTSHEFAKVLLSGADLPIYQGQTSRPPTITMHPDKVVIR